jgi:hypothetical protein
MNQRPAVIASLIVVGGGLAAVAKKAKQGD